MPIGDTLDERICEFFDLPNDHPTPIAITTIEDVDDRKEEIERAVDNMDEPVWFEWQEGLHGCSDEEIRNGRLAITTGVKYHPFNEYDVGLGHRVLVERTIADTHGYPCVNFPDVPDPKPASEVDSIPDFDVDALEDRAEFDTDIPTTSAEFERAEEIRESVEEAIITAVNYGEKEYRLFDLVRIYEDESSYFTFNIETDDGHTSRGRVTLRDDDTPRDVKVLY